VSGTPASTDSVALAAGVHEGRRAHTALPGVAGHGDGADARGVVHAGVHHQRVHPHLRAGRSHHAVQRQLGGLGVDLDDPVAAARQRGFGGGADGAQRGQHVVAHAGHGALGAGTEAVEAAVGQHLRVGRRAAEEAVAFQQQGARAAARGGHRGGAAGGTAAGHHHVELCPGLCHRAALRRPPARPVGSA
jgi:hypothetical protein